MEPVGARLRRRRSQAEWEEAGLGRGKTLRATGSGAHADLRPQPRRRQLSPSQTIILKSKMTLIYTTEHEPPISHRCPWRDFDNSLNVGFLGITSQRFVISGSAAMRRLASLAPAPFLTSQPAADVGDGGDLGMEMRPPSRARVAVSSAELGAGGMHDAQWAKRP